MDERNNDFDFDFTPIGQAIKKARTSQGMTREQLARIVDYDPRHLQAIENEGQYPSLELFIQLVTMFNISVVISRSACGIAADIRTGIVPHRITVAVIGVGKGNRPDVTRSKRRRRHYG